MTWEYALIIGLVAGLIIGALAMRFGNRKLRQQTALQQELDKSKAELETYRQELVNHFSHSAELLEKMAQDYRQFHKHMVKSSSTLLPDMATSNPFSYLNFKPEASGHEDTRSDTDHPPRDYSEGASGLFRPERKE
ncbi:Putative cytochrome d ubiquinol oxidase subunit 3 [Leminorella richardii]|uniref:Z-ring associated protein G n=1 Tax=Leminorella richardii TaxID=158841 RepID=A0A2X4UWN4_9GAMM|nr:Z-ring associated protein ZapG [Leminorella richardii]SQI43263.1 Putative cytochrome d ubiquinol oxidase subunit 3 [Leminorella richardii]